MNMQPVNSSQIKAVGYDAQGQILAVDFHRSGIYTYSDVPREIYEGMIAAESVGKFFDVNVKGKYHFSRPGKEFE